MKFSVQRLRRNGACLLEHELCAPEPCDLQVGDLSHVIRRRSCRAAQAFSLELYGNGIRREIFPPLFEPRLAVVDGGFLVLTGTELVFLDGTQHLVGQAWKCSQT